MRTQSLSRLQLDYLKRMGWLLASQLVLLLIIMIMVVKMVPKWVCLFTCTWWIDFLLYLTIGFILIWACSDRRLSRQTRMVAFYGLGVLMSYLLAVQFNLMRHGHEKQSAQNFLAATAFTISAVIIVVLMLPFLLPHAQLLSIVGGVLLVALLGLILWGLFVGKKFLMWVTISLIIFLGLLITDMVMLVQRCKSKTTCDPLDGASLLYVDLINILQKIFMLLQSRN